MHNVTLTTAEILSLTGFLSEHWELYAGHAESVGVDADELFEKLAGAHNDQG